MVTLEFWVVLLVPPIVKFLCDIVRDMYKDSKGNS